MIRYTCTQCRARLESPLSLAGQRDKCPMCGHVCTVPIPKKAKKRVLLAFAGIAGILIAATVVVVLVMGAGSNTPPSRSQISSASAPQQERTMFGDPVVATAPSTPSRPQSQPASKPQDAPLSPEQIFERASPAVVYIVVRDGNFKPIGLGSGFFVDAKGLIVTNYHVIKGAEFATARLGSGATLFVDGVAATDPDSDLALLKVSGAAFAFLKNADGPLPKVGSAVYAIGNPQGLENTFSGGMVSGHREIKEGLTAIQVTAPISPGSSGGPLLNAGGEVVGVTTAYLAAGQNLNFAVPVAAVQRLMQKQGKVQTLASAGGGRLETAETEELDKAWAAMAKKDWKGASEILTRLRKSQTDNPLVWYALARLHGILGNAEIAIQHYKQAIALKPDYVEAYFFMGISYSGLELYTEAVAAYKQAIALKPDYADAYSFMGHAYSMLKRYPEALAACKQVIALKPDYADGYDGMGNAYQYLKKYPEAIEAYKKSITLKPDDWVAYFQMGQCYEELGQHAAALAAYRESLRLNPTNRFEAADSAREGIRRLEGRR